MSLNLRQFDGFPPDQIAALPRKLRRSVIADRKCRVTAELIRSAATPRAATKPTISGFAGAVWAALRGQRSTARLDR